MKKPYQIEAQRAVKQSRQWPQMEIWRGSEQGYCVVMGQKVPVKRPRMRAVNRRQGSATGKLRVVPSRRTADGNRMGKVDARPEREKYGQAIRQFTEAYGLEKSAVSEHFIQASRAKLK